MTGKHDRSLDDEMAKKLLLTGPITVRGLHRSVRDALRPGHPSRHRAFMGGDDDIAPTLTRLAAADESATVGSPSTSGVGEALQAEAMSATAASGLTHPDLVRDAHLDTFENERAWRGPEVDRGASSAEAAWILQSEAAASNDGSFDHGESPDHESREDLAVGASPGRGHDQDVPRDWEKMEELYRRLVTMPTNNRTTDGVSDREGWTSATP